MMSKEMYQESKENKLQEAIFDYINSVDESEEVAEHVLGDFLTKILNNPSIVAGRIEENIARIKGYEM